MSNEIDGDLHEMACLNPIHGRPLHYVMKLGGKPDGSETCPECHEAKFSKFVCGDGTLVTDPREP